MLAEVISVVEGVNKVSKAGKPYTVTEFTYQGPAYKGVRNPPVTRQIFDNAPQHDDIIALKSGDSVELTFLSDQYKSLCTVTKASKSSASATPASQRVPWNDDTPLRIARAVALKAAVDTVGAYLASGMIYTKKDLKKGVLNNEIGFIMKAYESYLTLQDDMDTIIESVEGLEQETFNEEEEEEEGE